MKIKHPSVYTIVLHWKAYDATRACLLSLRNVTYPSHHVIVVDNASNDGSIEKLRNEFQEVLFLYNEDNFGFARGCNTGLREAYRLGADYVLLLNNDMQVEPGFLEPAVLEAQKHADPVAVTGKIMVTETPDIFWQAGGDIDPIRIRGLPRGKGLVDRGQYDEVCETGWASGAMSLFPRSILEKVGFLPEEYFFGDEEWDYSTAIRRAGLKILYVPTFKAYHRVGASYRAGHPVLNVYGGYLNKMIYAEKWMPKWMWVTWRMAFKMYLRWHWPRLAREGCQSEADYQVRLRAAYMAFEDHKRIKRVGLAELQDAARRLGPSPTWGNSWNPR
jgi:GT2 family glycosyltransferase